MKNSQNHLRLFLFFLFFPGIHTVLGQWSDSVRDVKLLLDTYRFNQANVLASQYLQTDSSNVSMLLLKGKALAGDYKYSEAKTVLLKVVRIDSTNIPAWFDLMNVSRQLGNSELAVVACKKILRLDSSNRYFNLQLSNLYYNNEEYEKAKNVLILLYQNDTLDLYVLKQLGNCYSELKKADSAIFFYIRVLNLYPSDVAITGKLINLYIKIKALKLGLDISEKYLSIDSTNAGIFQMNGFCCYLLKDYYLAEKRFLKGIELGDDSKFTRKYLGLCYYKQELYDRAEPLFAEAYRMDTTDSEMCFYYGVSAYRSMLLDTGLIYLNKTLKLLMPSIHFLSSIYVELAGVYNERGLSDTALVILMKAREINPDNNLSLFRIAYQYDYYLRQPKEALTYYQEFIKNEEKSREDKPQSVQEDTSALTREANRTSSIGDPLQSLKAPRQYSNVDFAARRIEELIGTLKK
ncbi:MAG: tetratricopeptide repeat protein [Bacteroidales bacterium]|nr:tetratricopeptide repeat protein [Bacteroidales bacterium]MDD4602497.1 tetratricopeptide repeat protein [Bacteroidales bacterium]